jgi:hypothetical protein
VRDPSQVQLPHGSFDIYAKGRVFHEGRPVKDGQRDGMEGSWDVAGFQPILGLHSRYKRA